MDLSDGWHGTDYRFLLRFYEVAVTGENFPLKM